MSQSREEWLTEMTETLGVDPEDVLEVAAMFFDAIDERVQAILEAHDTGDIQELTRFVHGLKGDAANMGFKQISAVARVLETQGRNGAGVDFATQYKSLVAAVAEQRRAIDIDSPSGESPS